MCAIFGVLDYKGELTPVQRLHLIQSLGTAAEIRGTDATGIAFFQGNKLTIQKAPKPAHKMKYRIPAEVRYIMGHTRMTTQGKASLNQNNHPFRGVAGKQKFALAHNGVLTNDWALQMSENLPKTTIETDSYVAVQLIEKEKQLSFNSLKNMAEAVRGSFVFTVLDQDNNLYFVKGDNPLTIYHYPDLGLYLYASTGDILDTALTMTGMRAMKHKTVCPKSGDILKIDSQGHQEQSTFWDADRFYDFAPYDRITRHSSRKRSSTNHVTQQEYLQALKVVAVFHGFEARDIDALIEDGYTLDDIEDLIYCEKHWS